MTDVLQVTRNKIAAMGPRQMAGSFEIPTCKTENISNKASKMFIHFGTQS